MADNADDQQLILRSNLEGWQKWTAVGIATLIFFLVSWLAFRPALRDDSSNDDTQADVAAIMSPLAENFSNQIVDEPFPVGVNEPLPIEQVVGIDRMGLFSGSEGVDAFGKVMLFRLADGSHLLRFEDFVVDTASPLTVELSLLEFHDEQSLEEGRLEIAPLKSAFGNQNYVIPSDVEVDGFETVVLWCADCPGVIASAVLPR